MTESTAVSRPQGEDWRYYLRLVSNSFATMLDLGLYALGAALAGLGIALVLAGLGLVDRDTGLSTGSGLVSAMVLGIAGAFLMGIASEGPARRNNRASVRNELERALSRAVSSVLVGIGLIFAAGLLLPLVGDYPAPLSKGVELVRRTGIAGLWPVPLIGVPLAWAVRHPSVLGEAGIEVELPVMFTVWILALLLLN
jgi:hypothetical protein